MNDNKLYSIYRVYENGRHRRRMAKDLTLKEAQKWCHDPETSSMTAKQPRGTGGNGRVIEKWHGLKKHWFDGYEQQ